eukprot:5915688-Amphidinium_carterae.1
MNDRTGSMCQKHPGGHAKLSLLAEPPTLHAPACRASMEAEYLMTPTRRANASYHCCCRESTQD